MAFDSLTARAGGEAGLSPMQIASHPLFTAREKIDLLHRLKAEVTGALENDRDLGLSPGEIDAAIAEIRAGVQNGEGSRTVLEGDS